MMSSSSGDNNIRTVQLLDENGNVVQTISSSLQGSNLEMITFTISAGGTYYIASSSGGVNVYGIEITYSSDDITEG